MVLGCQEHESPSGYNVPVVTAGSTSVSFAATAGATSEVSFTVTTPQDGGVVSVSLPEDVATWLDSNVSDSTATTGTITFTTSSANYSVSTNSGTVTVNYKVDTAVVSSATITVTQKAFLELSAETVTIEGDADSEGTVSFTVAETGGTFSFDYNGSAWLSAEASEVSESTGTITFTASSANDTGDERSTEVTITYTINENPIEATVTVTQAAAE